MKKLFVIFAAIALVGAFALPAAAEDWSFYGSSRMTTFMVSADDDAGDDSQTTWDLQGNARIGARVKTGDVSGRFEYGSTPNLRLLYGEWDFGGGKLLVGQAYTPLYIAYSSQAWASDNGLWGMGDLYGGRNPQIKLKMGGLNVAALKNVGQSASGGANETTLPKLELSYNLSLNDFFVDLYGGYQSYTIKGVAPASDEDVVSTAVGIGAGGNFGPAYVKAAVGITTNPGNAGWTSSGSWGKDAAGEDENSAVFDGTNDNDAISYHIVVGFKASDTMSLEAGYGSATNEQDVSGAEEDDISSAYAQATINLADGFFIVPEIGMVDYGQNNKGVEEGSMTYFGAKWQMNF